MRLSINLLCETGFVDESCFPTLEMAREYGFDGVEIPVLSGSPSHYESLARKLDGLGLDRTITAITASPDASPVSADTESRAAAQRHFDWIMDCADALGASCIGGPFHAPIGHFTGSGPQAEELERCAQAHRRIADRAQRNGQLLALEPLNRFETYFLNTMEQALDYVKRVDHPALGIMYDTFHANIEERDQPAAIASVAGHIAVLHISENDRGIPGRGHIDFPPIMQAVTETGFDGWVVVEAFGSGVPELAAATRIWRPMFPDTRTLFAESAHFVRDLMRGAAAT